MPHGKKNRRSALITQAGSTYLTKGRVGSIYPTQSIPDPFNETMEGEDFNLILPVKYDGIVSIANLLWQSGNPILGEFEQDRPVRIVSWHLTGKHWWSGLVNITEGAPNTGRGVYTFDGDWPIDGSFYEGHNVNTAGATLDVPAGAWAFLYVPSGDSTLTIPSGSDNYTLSVTGGGVVFGQPNLSGAPLPSAVDDAAVTVTGTGAVYGIGYEVII